uniref:Uncharacterized protein n=1 Tax=Acrobeloides nanus TaxID=290746 RepID=A0A914CBC9_9BILA
MSKLIILVLVSFAFLAMNEACIFGGGCGCGCGGGGGGLFGRKKRDLTADKPSGDLLSLRFKRKFEEQSQIAEPVFA